MLCGASAWLLASTGGNLLSEREQKQLEGVGSEPVVRCLHSGSARSWRFGQVRCVGSRVGPPVGLTACNRSVRSASPVQAPMPRPRRAADNRCAPRLVLGSCQLPGGATKTDGRSCSGPFQRSRVLARPTFPRDASSFRMFKGPVLVFVFTLGRECLFHSCLASPMLFHAGLA